MSLSNSFDRSRLWWLMKLELTRSKKGILMTLMVAFGIHFFIGMLLSLVLEPHIVVVEHSESFAFLMIIAGFILSSLAFGDLRSALKRVNYLMLPVSTFERFLCMWLLTSIGWILLITISFTLYTLIANPIGQLIFRQVTFMPFDPLGPVPLSAMKYYFVCQSIFLAGAAGFRGYALPKTLLVLIGVATVFGGIFWLIMSDVFLSEHECSGGECELIDVIAVQGIWQVAKGVFWWLLAPLFWVITYFRLKEQEV